MREIVGVVLLSFLMGPHDTVGEIKQRFAGKRIVNSSHRKDAGFLRFNIEPGSADRSRIDTYVLYNVVRCPIHRREEVRIKEEWNQYGDPPLRK